MSGDCHKGWYYASFQILPERSGSDSSDVVTKDVWIPVGTVAAATQDFTSAKPDTDLDLDDVAATSAKARIELDMLRNECSRHKELREYYAQKSFEACNKNQRLTTLLREAYETLSLVGCTPENSRRDSAEIEELQERILAAIGGV